MERSRNKRGLIRSRWAAIGAAVAVTLGGGGLIGVSAAGSASSFTTVDTARIMDTRPSGERVANEWVRLQVTGEVPTYTSTGVVDATVVPAGAEAVAVNLTVTGANSSGFMSAVACTEADMPTGLPSVSAANFSAGVDVANALTVPLGADGSMCIYVYGSTHVLVDASGYYSEAPADYADADEFNEIAASVAWPVMTMQYSTVGLTMRGDFNCDNTTNMIQPSNIGAVIDTDVNASEQDCYSVLPLSTPSSMGGLRWMPTEVVVCANIATGAEITSIVVTGVNPGGAASIQFPLFITDNPLVDDGCYKYLLEWDAEDSPWGFAAYQMQFGTSWVQDGGEVHLESVEVTYLMQEAGGDAPTWVGDYASLTGYDGWEIPN